MESVDRVRRVEIEICSVCDLNCTTCDRFIDRAPTGPMTLHQIEHFVRESQLLGWEWDRIRILGGEPTMHPHFRAVVAELAKCREWFPETLLQVVSNSVGALNEHRSWLIANDIKIDVNIKDGKIPSHFCNMWRAPQDVVANTGQFVPCLIFGRDSCGVGLTKHGYFLCGAGAAISRLSGLDIGIMRLSELTWEALIEQSKQLCRLCGHSETVQTLPNDAVETKFWRDTFDRYTTAISHMKVYGDV